MKAALTSNAAAAPVARLRLGGIVPERAGMVGQRGVLCPPERFPSRAHCACRSAAHVEISWGWRGGDGDGRDGALAGEGWWVNTLMFDPDPKTRLVIAFDQDSGGCDEHELDDDKGGCAMGSCPVAVLGGGMRRWCTDVKPAGRWVVAVLRLRRCNIARKPVG